MGLSSKKSTTVQSNDPWGPAQPYILKGLEQTGRVFDANQPQLDRYAAESFGTYGRMAPGAESGITAAQDLTNRTIRGEMLGGNPFMDNQIAATKGNVLNDINSNFSLAGRYGSGAHQGVIAQKLAEAENSIRYQNYDAERQRQIDAMDQAQQLMAGSQGLLNQTAELPWIGVGALNGNVRQASSGYGTSTTKSKTSGGIGSQPLNAGATLGSAAIMASDERVKQNVSKIGERPDGLGVYSYQYNPELDPTGAPQVGVMAQEVEQKRPDALGPTIDGIKTVDYSQLDTPDVSKIETRKPGMMENLLNPDVNTEQGRRGLAAQMILANGPGFIGNVGRGLFGASQYKIKQDEKLADRQHEEALAQTRRAQANDDFIARENWKLANPGQTAAQQNYSFYNGLTPDQQKTFRPMLGGYQYTPEGIAARVDSAGQIANVQGAARAAHRAPASAGKVRYVKNPQTGQYMKWVD